ncbi:MAG TPA: ABC transporter permease [Chloroflexota bacterium]|nr:ABC transporter permease [Chloroflexota bacterium]
MIAMFLLSLRALGRGRRLLAVGVLLSIPPLLALLYALTTTHPDGHQFVVQLFDNVILPVLLPLTALIFGTSALGSEIEDRTLVYLTLRPVSRLSIALAKWLAAAVLTVALVEGSLVLMNLLGTLNDSPGTYVSAGGAVKEQASVLAPLLAAGLLGGMAYSAVFLVLGRFAPKRGLLIGLVYVLGWEGLAAGLSTALATLSVRDYVQGVLDAALGNSPLATLTASSLGGSVAGIVLLGITIGGVVVAALSLRRIELP